MSHTNCCVPGCTLTYENSAPGTRFFVFPSRTCFCHQRQTWIDAIRARKGRDGLLWEPTKNSRVCSLHFVGGVQSKNRSSPSYAPTIFPSPKPSGVRPQHVPRLKKAKAEMTFVNSTEGVEKEAEGPPEAKRLKMDLDDVLSSDCDMFKVVDEVIKNMDLEKMWQQKLQKFAERLGYINELEKQFIEIDITFDKMERDLAKLKAKRSRRQAEALNLPEIHFMDVFVREGSRLMNTVHTSTFQSNDAYRKLDAMQQVQRTAQKKAPVQSGQAKSTQPDEIVPVGKFTHKVPNLPPEGPVVRKELDVSSKVYATRSFPLGVFYKARIAQVIPPSSPDRETLYKVKFDSRKSLAGNSFSARQMSYVDPPSVILPVGSRIVATYSDESWSPRQSLYAGIIAEPPKPLNRYRYLIFFDDGYAQYVAFDKVYLMCGTSKGGVWEDMHEDVQDFVRGYLEQYPERPMLRMQKGQTVKTEWKGRWWAARVIAVDASLVKMAFEADERTEWIYRGSTRFAPLFAALHHAAPSQGGRVRRHNLMPAMHRQHRPVVEYTRSIDDRKDEGKKNGQKNFARKSTTQERKDGEVGSTVVGTPLSQAGTREILKLPNYNEADEKTFVAHNCSSKCITVDDDPDKHLGINLLVIPCKYGWRRCTIKPSKKSRRLVSYTAPCGRRVRGYAELLRYLRATKSKLTVDLFCFDSSVNVFCQFVPQTVLTSIKDLTYGKELVPVSCVNSLDNTYPPYVEYSASRYPGKNVVLNLDSEFLCGCDCEDDCQDRDKCACQQLTVSATEALPSGRNPEAGYKHRRLPEPLITGVYECNVNCKCSKGCLNRVVQNGLRTRLQVFMTERRGWGIRCLDDIPQGSFVCVYAGQLLNEQGANEDGNQYGDEYLAELDHIEVVEKQKEGYESDVVEPKGSDEESDDQDTGAVTDYDDASVDEDELQDSDSDSVCDLDEAVAEAGVRKKSARICKKKQMLKDEDSSDSRSKSSSDKKSSDSELRDRKHDDESRDSQHSQDSRNADDKGDQSEASDNGREKGRLQLKKTQKSGADGAVATKKSSDSKSKVGPLDSPTKVPNPSKYPPTRSFFNEEYCYIMDAKNCGNMGRYLNHSCTPNVYVQNVFVDTHDLRFPWVAFFAARYIRAGVELTWDYNYDIGSVPGRIMYCHCGSEDCRGRLI
ncbi:histone-lysine N-methyltransferase SETDB1-like isoform X3 [Ornithodoros turicata]|uniref:histone-lysine N-methyltransferase SETDB1-like isoform X3 n=1 Tax=Ornithodoros turicata TaxID=34597 RepID=UPI00313A487E